LTILVVEQDLLTAFELARRGFVIELGRIGMSGETRLLAEDQKIRQAYMGI
jgi:branched-chain amino acid transport system ATP-binding protein